MRNISIFIFLTLIILCTFHCANKEKIVAEIGSNDKITLSEFQEAIQNLPVHFIRDPKTLKGLKKHLNKMIDDKIAAAVAIQKGIHKTPQFLDYLNAAEIKTVNTKFVEQTVLNDLINESMLRDFYKKSRHRLVLRSVFIKNTSNDPETVNKNRKKAEKIRQEIEKIRSFASAARTYSDDKKTASMGGLQRDVEYINPKNAFQRAAFSLPKGKLSKVIEDVNGFYIIKVEEIETVKQKPYNETKVKIQDHLKGIYYDEINQRTREFMASMQAKYEYGLNEATMDSLASLFNLAGSIPADSLKTLVGKMNDQYVLTAKDTVITPLDFWDMLNGEISKIYNNKIQIEAVIEKNLLPIYMFKEATEQKLKQHPDVKKEVRKHRNYALKNMIIQQEVYDLIHPSEEEVRSWFDANAMERYGFEEMVAVQEIQVSDENLANEIAKRAKGGEDFKKLLRKYTKKLEGKK